MFWLLMVQVQLWQFQHMIPATMNLKTLGTEIIEVVAGGDIEEAFTVAATVFLINSGFLNEKSVEEAKQAMIEWLEKEAKVMQR